MSYHKLLEDAGIDIYSENTRTCMNNGFGDCDSVLYSMAKGHTSAILYWDIGDKTYLDIYDRGQLCCTSSLIEEPRLLPGILIE